MTPGRPGVNHAGIGLFVDHLGFHDLALGLARLGRAGLGRLDVHVRGTARSSTAGGIVLPDTAKEKPQEAEVLSLGTGGKDEDGKTIEFTVKVGDKVLISKYGGTEVKVDGQEVLIVSESDILGIVA